MSDTADAVEFSIGDDLKVYYISFDIILVESTSSWIWIEQAGTLTNM